MNLVSTGARSSIWQEVDYLLGPASIADADAGVRVSASGMKLLRFDVLSTEELLAYDWRLLVRLETLPNPNAVHARLLPITEQAEEVGTSHDLVVV